MSNTQNTTQTRRTRATKQTLREVKQQIETAYPLVTRIKVKAYYCQGKIRISASIGIRRLHATGRRGTIMQRFAQIYEERYPTAFPTANS